MFLPLRARARQRTRALIFALHEFSEDSELKAVRTEYRAVVGVKEFGTNIIVVAIMEKT